MAKNNFNIGGQSTPMRRPDPGYYRAPEKPKLVFNIPKPPSKTPNMDSLRAGGGVITKQASDMARSMDRNRNNKSFGGKGWGGP